MCWQYGMVLASMSLTPDDAVISTARFRERAAVDETTRALSALTPLACSAATKPFWVVATHH
jgi:hypothetical protein